MLITPLSKNSLFDKTKAHNVLTYGLLFYTFTSKCYIYNYN